MNISTNTIVSRLFFRFFSNISEEFGLIGRTSLNAGNVSRYFLNDILLPGTGININPSGNNLSVSAIEKYEYFLNV